MCDAGLSFCDYVDHLRFERLQLSELAQFLSRESVALQCRYYLYLIGSVLQWLSYISSLAIILLKGYKLIGSGHVASYFVARLIFNSCSLFQLCLDSFVQDGWKLNEVKSTNDPNNTRNYRSYSILCLQ